VESLLLEQPKAYLRYLDFPGQEVPLVFLHGLGCASIVDYPLVVANAALAGHRFVLADFLGHGYSDAPDAFDYTLESHAETISGLLDHLSIHGAAVVGHSMGGAVAITLAALRPDLVSRLILMEGNLDPGGGLVSKGTAEQTESDFVTAGHAALVEWFRTQGSVTRMATFSACRSIGLYRSAVGLVKGTQPTMRERLYEMSIPRVYVFGEQNLPDEEMELLPEHGVQVDVVPKAGHDMAFDNPTGVAETLSRALQVRA
jgi:haloalkane dehalogenase